MIYGLYLSATGVQTSTYRQDVIANNLANADTTGFKRDLALFRERPVASAERADLYGKSNPLLDRIGGGTYAEPTTMDMSTGPIERTGNVLDAAIDGPGFFSVSDHGQTRLTRNGQFMLDRDGGLITAGGGNQPVMGDDGHQVILDPALFNATTINNDGTISQNGAVKAQLAVVDVADPSKLKNEGGTYLSYADSNEITPSTSQLRGESIENANVDPTTELTQLMESQRQLEMNANMIHYQDSTLDKLVNSVGKIS